MCKAVSYIILQHVMVLSMLKGFILHGLDHYCYFHCEYY